MKTLLFCIFITRVWTADQWPKIYYNYYSTEPPQREETVTLKDIPAIPEGNRQFQFYILDSRGKLQKQWMSLQEVQNIIIEYYASIIDTPFKSSLSKNPLKPVNSQKIGGYIRLPVKDHSQQMNPDSSVNEVLANVQKVMSKEITKTMLRNDLHRTPATEITTANDDLWNSATNPFESTEQNKELEGLMKQQVAALDTYNPWGIMTQSTSGGLPNYALNTVRELDETTTMLPNFEELNLIEENFIPDDGHSEKNTLDYTDNLVRQEPAIFYSRTGHPDGFSGKDDPNSPSDNGSYDTDEVFKENSPSIVYLSHSLLEESDDNIDNRTTEVDEPSLDQTDLPLEIWATSNPIYPKDKPDDKTVTVLIHSQDQVNSMNSVHESSKEDNEVDEQEVEVTDNSLPNNISTISSTSEPTDETTENNTSSHSPTEIPWSEILSDIAKVKYNANDNEVNNRSVPSRHELNSYSLDDTSAVNLVNNFLNDLGISNKDENLGNELEEIPSLSNVLSPSEMAYVPPEVVANLEGLTAKTDYDYDYSPVYLEDIEDTKEVNTSEYGDSQTPKPAKNSTRLDFPGPNVTDSYHQPEHLKGQENSAFASSQATSSQVDHESDLDFVDPTQFLPAFNPALAQRENPLRPTPPGNLGLEATITNTDPDVRKYIDAMNDITFQVYKRAAFIHRRQNMIMSPINLISTLSMLLLGARNNTSDSLSRFLQIDQYLTFNPHLIMKTIREAITALNSMNHEAAIVNNIFVEQSDRLSSHPLDYFVRTLDFYYGARIDEVPQGEIGPKARDRANEEIRKVTLGAVQNFLKPNASLKVLGPLSVVSSAYIQGDWGLNIDEKDLTDMSFIRFPSAERRLIKTVGVVRRMNINAGYSEEGDATVTEIALKDPKREMSLIMVMPGQQKSFIANGLSKLEQSLEVDLWSKLLRAVIPHSINFKMPIFSHRNYLNLSGILSIMGLRELFQEPTDFSGINGVKNLFLGDLVQLTEFHSCKLDIKALMSENPTEDERKGKDGSTSADESAKGVPPATQRGGLLYPASNAERLRLNVRNSEDIFPGRFDRTENTLAYDRAFFYVLRHNPTGLILFIGRYLDPETF